MIDWNRVISCRCPLETGFQSSQAQVENAASWEYGHRSDGWRIIAVAKEDPSILCGDYYNVELEDGTVYRPRVYKRRFRNGKMFLTGYNGRNPEY